MDLRRRWIGIGAAALAVVGAGAAVAAGGDEDRPLEGSTLQRATEAARSATGGGTVVEAETGDAGAAYEVEVRRPDGTVVEVRLDDRFRVIGSAADDDGSNEDAGGEEGGR